jgi:peptidoglycan/xylan/chitin deacetylase (PgdA/CDA1 family)
VRRYLVRALAIGGFLAAIAGATAIVVDARHHAKPNAAPTVTKPQRKHRRHAPPRPKGPHDAPVPILMYHVIADAPASTPYPELYVKPADFTEQIAWLAQHGYHAVTLRRVFDFWRGKRVLPPKPVVLSFDDGYRSDVAVALPVLRKRHWPGVLNLVLENLTPVWGSRPGMVRKLIAAGWEIDAHTINHVDLTTLSADRLKQEVAGSRAAIRKQFGVPVDFFCYPVGKYDDTVIAAVKAAGFLGATTENAGLATPRDPFTLSRIRVAGTDGVGGLAQKLAVASAA